MDNLPDVSQIVRTIHDGATCLAAGGISASIAQALWQYVRNPESRRSLWDRVRLNPILIGTLASLGVSSFSLVATEKLTGLNIAGEAYSDLGLMAGSVLAGLIGATAYEWHFVNPRD